MTRTSALLLALIASVWPLLRGGFPMGHDWIFELVRIAEFRFAAQTGQWPPYWAPDLYGGFGSPIFLFYPPLFLAIAAGLVGVTASVTAAAVIALVLFSCAGMFTMWQLVRQLTRSTLAADVAAILFALSPYLLADKWLRNANAEFAALTLCPGVLLGATARTAKPAFWWTAVSLSGIIIAHNIIALIALPVLVGVAAFVHRKPRPLLPIAAGILTALMVTAFFWVPAFYFLPRVNSSDLLTGKFDFHGQFPSLISLLWPHQFYSPGLLSLPLLLALIFVPVADRHVRRMMRASAVAALVLLFCMLPVSTIVWENLPLLRYAQFPWRLNGFLAVLLCAGGGVAVAQIPRRLPVWGIELLCLLVAILNALPSLTRYEPIPSDLRAQVQPSLTPEQIQNRRLRTTVYDEYLPNGANAAIVRRQEGTVLFRKWAFPVWEAKVNGQSVPVESCSGLVCVRVADDTAQTSLTLREPSIRRWCKAVSGCALAILLGVAALQYRRPVKLW